MWILIILIILLTIAVKLWKFRRYWTDKGVPQIKPWPIFGNIAPMIFRKCSISELIQDCYDTFPNKRYFGIHQFGSPTIVIRCPELIKTVTIKEFDTFPEHELRLPPEVDPLFSNNIFFVRGVKRWHDLRSTLSPFFTSVKLKNIFGLMQQCVEQCCRYIDEHKDGLAVEMNEFFNKYTNDVIGFTAFGVTCNTFENPENEFYLNGKHSVSITAWKSVKIMTQSLSPFLVKFFGLRFVSPEEEMFFRSITDKSLKLREESKIVCSDLISVLLEARKTKPDVVLTDEDITANAFLFFLAGLDTTARALTFTFYEIAINPDIQRRLQDEIDNVLEAGEITYQRLIEMEYIDMVISESLRMWPPIMFMERSSVRPFIIETENPEEKRVHLECPMKVWIPVHAIHHDPQYYENPNQFNPERFSDDNKHNIKPQTYMPFGSGPRNCIGSRFALLKMKLLTFCILSKYDVIPTQKTPIPLVLERGQLFPSVKGGVWLELKRRRKL